VIKHCETALIVDDERIVRKLLVTGLSQCGYVCLEAGNAEEALRQMKDHAVQVVLLDIKMPGKSGIELLPELKAQYPDTVVIMATATVDTDVAIRSMKAGASDYFPKPFALEEVTLSIERALERRSLELEVREYRRHLEQKVDEQSVKIRSTFVGALTSLANALEAKDAYTNGHSMRVSEISVLAGTQNPPGLGRSKPAI
jgi:putative two-component system response regulator